MRLLEKENIKVPKLEYVKLGRSDNYPTQCGRQLG